MRDDTARENLRRRTQVEECESRLLSTVQSLADFHVEDLTPDSADAVPPAQTGNYDFTGLATVRTAFGLTGAGQTVAVIDSGIAYDHPALGGGLGTGYRVVGGWDFTEENDANPYDDRPGGAHGTHVAGIIGSTDTRSPGVAPGVDLVALRVFNDSGSGNFTWIEKALEWVHANRDAFENPITTVNLSIGAVWNSTNVPNWTTLEDEFAQLEADGIFIAVAAGNAFTTYHTAGLSYPAASPHVVPVAAVDGDGSISSFSQRQERVIAAPGRSIRSTVPDYLGNLNRKTDDFATMSGTSMASPYVAGASVLIRQAMQIAGLTNINQDSVYGVMRETADSVYDAITRQSYARLNVEQAIESILGKVWQFTLSGDVTGDSQADAIHRNAATGQWSIERVDGAQQLIGHWSQTNSYTEVQLADVNGDGRLDIVGRDSCGDWWATTNRTGNFTNQYLGHFSSAIAWQNVMLGDLDGDHAADIVGRDAATGNWIAIRSTAGKAVQAIANWNPANSYQNVSLIDITGDGRADIVGRDNHGDWWTATQVGSRFTNRYIASWDAAAPWQDVRTGDLDGDGRTDLAARNNSTGKWWAISFDGTRFTSRQFTTWNPLQQYSQATASPAQLTLAETRDLALGFLPGPAQSTATEPAPAVLVPCDDFFAHAEAAELDRPLTVAEPLLAAIPRVALTEDDVAQLVEALPGLRDEQTLVDLLDEALATDEFR